MIYFVESCVLKKKYVSVIDSNDVFKFLLAFLFALLHICCLTRCHLLLLIISVVCALEYIKHRKTTITSTFSLVQFKFKLFRER